MDLFYSKNIASENYTLSPDESRHCISVLRKKVNDKILITEGEGYIYSAEILEIKKNRVIYKNLTPLPKKNRKVKVHIAIAPTKNRVRFEWFLEKATEIGVDYIHPVICENSERKTLNIERCQKVLIAAMKQSQSAILPKINNVIKFKDFLENLKNKYTYIAHCQNQEKIDFSDILNKDKPREIIVLIGPEGDFSKQEVNYSKKLGIKPINLCSNKLRTETAGIIACGTIEVIL